MRILRLISINLLRTVCLLLLTIGFVLVATQGQAIGPYHIERTVPRVGQVGTTVEVTIQGAVIEQPSDIIFYRRGIRAVGFEKLPNLQYRIGLAHGGFINEQIRCKFEIAPDCPLGEHPFRIRFRSELSSIGTFRVTPFPVLDEREKPPDANNTIEKALAVTPNVSIHGHLGGDARGERDLFRVPVKAGGRLSIEVDSVRIADRHYADSEFDLALRVLDEAGKELAANDDNSLHLQDPVLSLKTPNDGNVIVEVRRSVFTPGDTDYTLHIGTNRRPLVAYPAGGESNAQQPVQMLGDPLGDFAETIAVPATAGNFEYYGDAPSSLTLRSCPYPNVMENAAGAKTIVEKFPAALNGIIESNQDVDLYQFAAKEGDRLTVRIFAAAIGSRIDAKVRILPLDENGMPGDVDTEVDDSPLSNHDVFATSFRSGGGLKEWLDPAFVWTAKTSGNYLLEVSDTSGAGNNLGVYRVEVEPAQDAIHTVLSSRANDWMECPRVTSLAIPQGNRWTVNLNLQPGLGSTYSGPLNIVAHGLPAGVELVHSQVPAGATLWPIQFVADATAIPAGARITLSAVPVDPAHKLITSSQQNIPFINHPGGDAWRTVRLESYILAVTDAAPFKIDITRPAVPLVRGGELAIPVKITRQNGFDGPVNFRCDWVSPGVGVAPTMTIPKGESEAILPITAEANAPIGVSPFVVVASTVREDFSDYVGTGHVRVSSEIVELTIAEPFVELASGPASVRRGERVKYVWSAKQKSPFEGEARVNLLGLPKGVIVVEPLPVLTKSSAEIAFEIEATGDALLGQVKGLSCEVIVLAAGQEIRQRSGNGNLRIDPAKE